MHKMDLSLVRAGLFSVPATSLESLANDSDVEFISADHRVYAALDYSSPSVYAPTAWSSGWDGKAIGVAVIDSGVSVVPDFGKRVVYQAAFGQKDGIDHYGHGVHVAGIIAADGKNSRGRYKGIAPGANILNFRVLDDKGAGTDSNVIAAIQQAISLKSRYNIRVLNLSLGRPVFDSYRNDPLCQAVGAAWRAGIVVVVSAGNEGRNNSQGTDGYATITSPGNDPYVITVGAVKTMGSLSRADDVIASYSSKGPTARPHREAGSCRTR